MMANRRAIGLACAVQNIEPMVMHDWWLSLVCSAFGAIAYVDTPTSLYRQHGDNEVGAKSYRPLERVFHFEDMRKSVAASAAQAAAFRKTYTDMFDPQQAQILDDFVTACNSEGVDALFHLTRSCCWKKGLRKLGQAAVAISNRGGVVAIVVTYNPKPARLKENLSAISGQVDTVLLFDNASKNAAEVEDIAIKMCDYYLLSNQNVGLAKSLNKACTVASEFGATHVLLLDQDSIAGKDMVAGQIGQFSERVALVSPQIIDRNKREGFILGEASVPIKRAITSGALVSLQAWQAVGGFDERLFVDWVDYEFSANLRAHGYRIVRDNQVMLLHEMGHREYAFTLPLPGGERAFYRTNHALSRQRDKARSWAIVRKKYGWSKIGLEERSYIAAVKTRDLILERNRLAILKAFIQGGKEGRKIA